jgi:hypothetical protein
MLSVIEDDILYCSIPQYGCLPNKALPKPIVQVQVIPSYIYLPSFYSKNHIKKQDSEALYNFKLESYNKGDILINAQSNYLGL